MQHVPSWMSLKASLLPWQTASLPGARTAGWCFIIILMLITTDIAFHFL
jgi:hypothetical protein